MTPKSLLRHPRCVSSLQELAEGRFEPVLDDAAVDPARVRRVVLVSGKLYYDLLQGARGREDADDVALVRLEQLYPFPAAELAARPRPLPAAAEIWSGRRRSRATWAPGASCASSFLDGDVADAARPPAALRRAASTSAQPAPGSHKVHVREQEAIVREALGS